ncbi:MAG TPA: tetratricopeptide repeat protein [Candidatus Omnitrophota bacterium]|nr:tetratricopeptide repeat protein [Candidatus Omnitrophota bacterium]
MPAQNKDLAADNYVKPGINLSFRHTGALFHALSVITLLVLSLSVYFNSFGGSFILDDHILIAENPLIRDFSSIPKLFFSTIGAGSGSDFTYYRPLQMAAYAVIYNFRQLDARYYHVANMLLHSLMSVSVYWMITTLFGDRLLALFSAALFSLHPVHAESVAYISGTGDCLSGLFIILSFIFYVKLQESSRAYFFIIFPAVYLLALFSKENGLIFPLLAVLYHVCFRKPVKPLPLILAMLPAAGYAALRLTVLPAPEFYGMSPDGILLRLPGAFRAITGYLLTLLAPSGLNMGHDSVIFRFADKMVITGALLTIFLVFVAIKKRKSGGIVFFSVFWFFITLLPELNLYPVAFYMADHYLYLPSIGFFLAAGWLFRAAYSSKRSRLLSVAGIVCLSGFYFLVTVRQNHYWSNDTVFYERTLNYNPSSFRALNNLGRIYEKTGQQKEAEKLYIRALEARPHKEAYNNLGNIYSRSGRTEEAALMYEKALGIDPGYAKALHNLAGEYVKMGRTRNAEKLYLRSIEKNPDILEAYCGLGALYGSTGRKKEALEIFGEALKRNPDYGPAITGIGNVYAANGEFSEALFWFEKALAQDPLDAVACNNIGNLHSISGRNDEAMLMYRKAISIDPDFAGAYFNLARLLSLSGDTALALKYYGITVEKDPGFGNAYINMAILHYLEGRYESALRYSDLARDKGFELPGEITKRLEAYRK